MSKPVVVVVGLGEVGGPLLEMVRRGGLDGVGVDVDPVALPERGTVDVMHVCFPFEIPDFIGEAVRYIKLLAPRLTIVDSTVAVGTTRALHERTGAAVAYSPVRGKHAHMVDDMGRYAKFVGGIDDAAGAAAAAHFASIGMPPRRVATPETAELAKLSETTYFGLLIAWAQEVERYAELVGADYDEVVAFYEEIGFFPPVKYTPGVIGGHCVMPNIEILDQLDGSPLLDGIRAANAAKITRAAAAVASSF